MIDRDLRTLVQRRAGAHCEYCRLPQAASPFARFHIEHIIALQHGGPTEAANLALACGVCNYRKGPNIASIDPETGQLVALYHPRRDTWTEHFAWQGTTIIGRTPIGRATVLVLAMNDRTRLEIRDDLQNLGESFTDL